MGKLVVEGHFTPYLIACYNFRSNMLTLLREKIDHETHETHERACPPSSRGQALAKAGDTKKSQIFVYFVYFVV